MFPRRKILLGLSAAMGANLGLGQTSTSPDPASQKEKNLTIGEGEAKRMLLLMDQDRSGKVSKQEFMRFMEAEFNRLDKNGDGELDVKELTKSQVRVRGAIHR